MAHYNRGNALRGLEQHEEAVASYRASLEAVYDPRFPGPTAEQQASQRWKTLSNMGDALRQMAGREAESIASYEAAIAIAPREAYTAHFNQGVVRYTQQEPIAAAEAFATAVAILPTYADAYNNLAAALEKLARYRESSAQFHHALRLWPARANPAHKSEQKPY